MTVSRAFLDALAEKGRILIATAGSARAGTSAGIVERSTFHEWRAELIAAVAQLFGEQSPERDECARNVATNTAEDVQRGLAVITSARLRLGEGGVTPGSVPSSNGLRGFENDVRKQAADVVVICALHKPELRAVLLAGGVEWKECLPEADDPHTYHRTAYASASGREIKVVAAAPNRMGMSASSVLATKMVLKFRPRLVSMVGIAAGVRRESQGFGDILAAEHTLDYGAGKVSADGSKTEFRPDPYPIGVHARLLSRLKEWERQRAELDPIQSSWPAASPSTRLTLHVGPLASGAQVINARQPVQAVLAHWRKLVGIEMEAYGVHSACLEATDPQPMFLCLKSICDFAEKKTDDWQEYAAYTSSELFRRFVTAEWDVLFPTAG